MTTIAISGKGGAGKTTIAAAMIRTLLADGKGPILAVDADPNSCLGQICGVEPEVTVAQLREQARAKNPTNTGSDRIRSFEYGIQQAVTEAKGFDLLTMGRPEGPDCYCAVNNLLRSFLDKLASAYKFVIVDNEAGMEHLSRRTTNNVELLCIVAEATPLGKLTATRIYSLAKELPIAVQRIGLLWNRAQELSKLDDIETLGCVPYDRVLFEASMQRKTIFEVSIDSPVFSSIGEIIKSSVTC